MTTYVYIRSEPTLWTTGFYDPEGHWEPESDWDNPQAAAERARWLNGGNEPPQRETDKTEYTSAHANITVEHSEANGSSVTLDLKHQGITLHFQCSSPTEAEQLGEQLAAASLTIGELRVRAINTAHRIEEQR
jgi:hypothetical protein